MKCLHLIILTVTISETTADKLRVFGIPENKISVIIVGADISYKPKLTVGIVGRIYPNSNRKGKDIVQKIYRDNELTEHINFITINEGWGIPISQFEDLDDFIEL